ncbi:uncharacterized protein LOC128721802 [Anopheles nili]|uniref:uncharacterized protein LOC128721802 n=1 Tax=Anopheles nili TaxID=185578 RepID=UPI00237AA32E|nr:uncharacterized protein LOC128721802 [Anopheles nili]
MANRCPQAALSSHAPRATSSALSPSSTGRPGDLSRAGQRAASGRTTVGSLIGKFESTGSEPTDVKVTANSGRASDSALITRRDSPIGRGSHPPEEIVTGTGGECSDKPVTMGLGEGPLRSGGHGRQRKTAVYSRLCLGEALLGEGGLLGVGKARAGPNPDTVLAGTDHLEVGWHPEVVRFPCVERLIELYANIIRQQEAEVQRFMSSIVKAGDKSRLDKAHGSDRRQGDIREEPVLPASVSLKSLPRLKTNPLRLVSGTTATEGDSHAQTTDTVVRATSQPKESYSPSQSDEGWRSSTQLSPYGSSDEEDRQLTVQERAESSPTSEDTSMKNRDKVTRSSSSDSALGLDEDLSQQEQQQMIATVGKVRRLTLGVSDIPLRSALLPVPEPSTLPSILPLPNSDHCPTVVRSKMILEAQLIELPNTGDGVPDQPGQQSLGCPQSTSVSRRESAQSYVSDSTEGVRYVRTPSVVVSDYSDDTMCGITLEEIEYFRRHRLRRGSADCESDISAASSCSNLNYCGSSISALEGCEYQCGLRTPERKVSDCSTCSTVSCDEDEGYSVVRSKLATLSPPSGVSEPAGGDPPVPAVIAKPASHPDLVEDVRVCSKKKVSHAAGCPAAARPL